MGYSIDKKIKAIEAYSKTRNLKKIAKRFSINASTLWRWTIWYQQLKSENVNKASEKKTFENEIMMLKEKNPDLTLYKASAILAQQNKKVSIKKIHTIWKKFGLTARSPQSPFSAYGPLTKESKQTIAKVKLLLNDNTEDKTVKIAGQLLNEMPSFPDDHESILKQIPYKYLSWRRQLDKLDADFSTTPKPVLLRKIKKIRANLSKNRLNYSALLAGVFEILIMHWMRMPKSEIKLNLELQKQKGRLREPVLNLALSFLAGTAYAEILDIKNCYRYIHRLQKLQRTLPYVQTYSLIGDLLTFITEYKSAIVFYKKAFSHKLSKDMNINLRVKIGLALAIAGDYQIVERIHLKKIGIKPENYHYDTYSLIKALCAIGQGKIDAARSWLQQCLERSKKEQLRNYIYTANSCLASINCAFMRFKDARKVLKNVKQLQQKFGLERAVKVLDALLGNLPLSEKFNRIPTLCILNKLYRARQKLRPSDYYSALNYARKKGQLGFFHRMIMFFPEPVLALLKKGKKTYLPNALLRLPIFNNAAPVFYIKYLGDIIVYRNHKYLRIKLSPQEESLLVQIAQRAGEPGKAISIKEITDNYWSRSRNPDGRLAHVLVQIRRKLAIPKHTLSIIRLAGIKKISNLGFYATTDLDDFNIELTQARALENLNEWSSARQKYREAFCIIRGAPFRNSYDNWADNQRRIILTRIENEMKSYSESCRSRIGKVETLNIEKRLKGILSG